MSQSPAHRTAVLVDQHPLWLDTVEQVVERADVEVLAKCTTGAAAGEQVAQLMPDLLITGLELGDGILGGTAFIARARTTCPDMKVIVFSAYDDAGTIDAAFAAGAHAYVLKTANGEDLRSAVRQAFRHSLYLASARPSPAVGTAPPKPSAATGLTPREVEILQLVAEGHSNAQLAGMLWVTEQTVKFHLSNIYRKLGVSNRTEAGRWAQLNGMLSASGRPSIVRATAALG